MKPSKNAIPIQILAFVSVSRNACSSPAGDKSTAPISVIPRFMVKSPIFAHTTSARTISRVLIRSFRSLPIGGGDAGLFQKLSHSTADDRFRRTHERIVAEKLNPDAAFGV